MLRSKVKPNRALQHVVVEGYDSIDNLVNLNKVLCFEVRCEDFKNFIPQVRSPADRNFKKRLLLFLEALVTT